MAGITPFQANEYELFFIDLIYKTKIVTLFCLTLAILTYSVVDIHYFDSPLGTIKVKGDVAGVQEVCFEECNLEQKNSSVPNSLIPCVKQLERIFSW